MERSCRRQLLAFGQLGRSEDEADASARAFIRHVLAGPLESRPNTQGVEDVLLSSGATPAMVARFVQAFDAAVWGVSRA